MPAPPPVVLWVDPGGYTGFASMQYGQFAGREYAWGEACDYLTGFCHTYRMAAHIGYEVFTILPGTHKLSPQPEAYELPGVIKYLCRTYGCTLLRPAKPDERKTTKPAELRALGWWLPGQDDEQSAAMHLLAWYRRENCVPFDVAGKLSRSLAVDG
jgi:hypothetical protein